MGFWSLLNNAFTLTVEISERSKTIYIIYEFYGKRFCPVFLSSQRKYPKHFKPNMWLIKGQNIQIKMPCKEFRLKDDTEAQYHHFRVNHLPKIPGECLSYFSYSIYNSHPCPRTYPKPCQLQIMTSPISMTPSLNSSIFLEYCLWSVYFNSPSIYWLLQYPSSSTSCAVLCLVTCHVRLFATPWTVAHQAPLSMGVLRARILEWVAMPSSRGSSQPSNWTQVSCIAGRFLTIPNLYSMSLQLPFSCITVPGKTWRWLFPALYLLCSWFQVTLAGHEKCTASLSSLMLNKHHWFQVSHYHAY